MIRVRLLEDGARNVKAHVTGVLGDDLPPTRLLCLDDLKPSPGAVKVTAALWLVQEKMGLLLWWGTHGKADEANLIFIAESRNAVKLEHGLHSPRRDERWDRAIWVKSIGLESTACMPKHFTLLLDLDKQQ